MTTDKRGRMPRAPRKFVRDLYLHGHHAQCETTLYPHEGYDCVACTCQQLDEDDWQSYLESVRDAQKEDVWLS